MLQFYCIRTDFWLYKSKDSGYYQIVDVFEKQVISADLIQATASFDGATFTQYLQTNVFAMSALEGIGVGSGGTVNYLTARTWDLSFRTRKLDELATEQFSVTIDYGGDIEEVFFWYAIIGDHPNAYKFLTTVDPRTKFQEITDTERDKFKFLVYKAETDVEKLSIKFADLPGGGVGPVITLGAGSTSDPNSLLGKGVIYKNETGMYMEYHKQDGSGQTGIIMDDISLRFKGLINELEYLDSYQNYFVWKYTGDPLIEAEKVIQSGEFKGLNINGVFRPFRKFTTDYTPE